MMQPSISSRLDQPLKKDVSFWGILATQFLGAFNDNVFKQTVLLIFVAIPLNGAVRDLQWLGTAVFALPFVLFSGFAGYLSDRWSKNRVIVLCKVAEIAIMASGIAAYYYFEAYGLTWGFVGLLSTILFAMGAQSAFFGPGKYGVLPELFEESRLSAANGMILMTTFLAIIFGTAFAGLMMEEFRQSLWAVAAVCTLIACVGTVTSLAIRSTAPAEPGLPFRWATMGVPREIRQLLKQDRALSSALLSSCLFWATGALAQPAVNVFGTRQLGLVDKFQVSRLVSMIGIGIATGSLLSGLLSGGRIRWGLLRGGAIGIFVCLTLQGITLPGGRHLLGHGGSLVSLFLLGVSTGFFAVPLQVFMQSRPPEALKGRMMATQNLLNWIAMLGSAGLYWGFNACISMAGWPVSTLFLLASLVMLPVLIWYRPSGGFSVSSKSTGLGKP